MQNFGTELRRRENPSYWATRWVFTAEFTVGDIVVDDCRFLNESVAVKMKEGIIIKIIRTGQENKDSHQSEQEFNEIIPDYTIEVGTGEQLKLYEQLDKIIDKLNKN
jgi:hypothetical protein